MEMDCSQMLSLGGVLLVSGVAAVIACKRMTKGFGPFNIKVLCIIIVAPLAAIIALTEPTAVSAATSILGAIAGYAFGVRDEQSQRSVG